jgi:hypothetical protein
MSNLLDTKESDWERELLRRAIRRISLSKDGHFGYVIPSAEKEARRRGIPESDQTCVVPFDDTWSAEAWDELILLATYYKYRRLKEDD